MRVTVRFEDYSDAVKEAVNEMVNDLCVAAAESLVEHYMDRLSRQEAPPHSFPDRTPYAYNGWKPGGYGPVNENTTVNNIPPEFSAVQTQSLYTYLRAESGNIGFLRQGHVTRRDQNYLLYYSIRTDGQRREWVVRDYKRYSSQLRSQLRSRMRANRASRGDSGVPF